MLNNCDIVEFGIGQTVVKQGLCVFSWLMGYFHNSKLNRTNTVKIQTFIRLILLSKYANQNASMQ